MAHLHVLYRSPGVPSAAALTRAQRLGLSTISRIDTEFAFYIQFQTGVSHASLTPEQAVALRWLLSETFEPHGFGAASFLPAPADGTAVVIEVGPRLNFTSAFSTNACSILRNCGVPAARVERYRRFALHGADGTSGASPAHVAAFTAAVHDRMTEWSVPAPLASFAGVGRVPAPVRRVPLLAGGRPALEAINKEMGLSFDAWDLDFYFSLFHDDLKRDPTDVELFDISQSNSEHSRHWFFRGSIVIDGVPQPRTLMKVVQATLAARPDNSIIAFADNSSAIRGRDVLAFQAGTPGAPSRYVQRGVTRHSLLTAETHNFPTGVAPFPGAETGTGGRIRDTHATGRGSHVVAGTAAYCVGNLHIPGYALPWEDDSFTYPPTLASPLTIEIEASNGASDYGNKFGEPVVAGFTRSVGLRLPDGERREYIKPIMFTAGVGAIDDAHIVKGEPARGMLVVKLGGPAYRIGMGGSAASSMMQGENKLELDFNAVQRGDAEMEQKVNRVIRACCELGVDNPIVSIHDQGAGGNCNVLKEIVSPAGGRINVRAILVGDDTLSVLEIWGAEYQEADALLIRDTAADAFAALCARERAPVAFVGTVTGDGRVVLHDSTDDSTPVDMDLEKVLGNMPQKTFPGERKAMPSRALALPDGLTLPAALDRVLRLLAVGSKRFLTNKVDRSVTGLVAQQQCVGPLHTPLADVAVIAYTYGAGGAGTATAIGEQPLKGLLSPGAMGRMAVAEAVTNLCGAYVTRLEDAKCSANWMWAAKLPHEGPRLYDACEAMAAFMIDVGVAVDGGKDSLSMAAKAPDGELVKAPGSLVISLYASCPDITLTLTPDLKRAGGSTLLLVTPHAVSTASTPARLGGSALAQVYGQVGALEECPDCESAPALVRLFRAVQSLLPGRHVLSAHDRSDGGLVVAALEMAFAGNVGVDVTLPAGAAPLAAAFAEEVGVILEVADASLAHVRGVLSEHDVHVVDVGTSRGDSRVVVRRADAAAAPLVDVAMPVLRDTWEATSFELDKLQCNPACVAEEQAGMATRRTPPYSLSFTPARPPLELVSRPADTKPRVVILREEGSNGDREMAAAFFACGFDVWDVTMSDLMNGTFTLDNSIRGLVFPGGFSYADVLDSAKGWAGVIRFHPAVLAQLSAFYARPDTFSLGVCNGCQLAALLGWVPFGPSATVGGVRVDDAAQPRFIHNTSGRLESRFSTVRIQESPAIMFKDMAGSVLGVWVTHGEGRAHFPEPALLDAVMAGGLAPLRYVDDDAAPTTVYPLNPNGSPHGIAGLCSPDGRHLAIMPHPERAHEIWQWPWMPTAWRAGGEAALSASPWLRIFQNAYDWCQSSA